MNPEIDKSYIISLLENLNVISPPQEVTEEAEFEVINSVIWK